MGYIRDENGDIVLDELGNPLLDGIPTTAPPTTVVPTTIFHSTAVPTTTLTTGAPTTNVPTTLAPTTLPPTSLTTAVPTTSVPTTLAPTTVVPTTLHISTPVPTTTLTLPPPDTVIPTTLAPVATPVPATAPPVIPPISTPQNWKDNKGAGPWQFAAQQNKWGYLNNPRWMSPPGAPVNYDGRESEEPQVWDINASAINGGVSHIPCGHWHKIVHTSIPPVTLPSLMCWQQGIEVGNDGLLYMGFITFDDLQAYLVTLSKSSGDLIDILAHLVIPTVLDGSALNEISGYIGNTRQEDSFFAYLIQVYDVNYWDALVIGINRSGTIYWKVVLSNYVSENSKCYCVIDMGMEVLSDGRLIVIYNNNDSLGDFSRLCCVRSSDFGSNWTAEEYIDVLDVVDGYWYTPSMCKDTLGNLYISATSRRYAPISHMELHMWKSTDFGVSWSDVSITFISMVSTSSIIAANLNIVCIFQRGTYGGTAYCYKSVDGGVNWVGNAIAEFFNVLSCVGVTDGVIVCGQYGDTGAPSFDAKYALFKTVDGVNFTMVYDLFTNGVISGINDVVSMRSRGDVVTYTHCNLGTPGNMQYLVSEDLGNSWNLVTTDIQAYV